MKNFKILSGLSLAAVLALIPAQSLSNSIATPELGHATNQNYSGGFNKNTSGKGGTTSSGNSVEMRGDPNGKDYSNSIIYGGGIGDGTKDGSVYRFEQTEAAKDNKLTIKDGASAWIAIGGEGKGAQRNTLNVENATVDTVVGGNGTWNGLADHSGDATDNTVNIKQGSTIKGTFNGFNASQQ